MKKIGLILLMILSVLMSFGCAKKEAEIKSITVEFPYEDILCRSIKVDFEEEKATINDRDGQTDVTSEFSYEAYAELKAFAEEEMVSVISAAKSNDNHSVGEKTWYVKIVTDDGNLKQYGIGDEDYPVYWGGLMRLLGM